MARGRSGDPPPEWFALIQAAKYLGVAPWDLARRPYAWQQWAQASMWIEQEVQGKQRERQDSKNKRAQQKQGASGGKRRPGGRKGRRPGTRSG